MPVMMAQRFAITLMLCGLAAGPAQATGPITLTSPDGSLEVRVAAEEQGRPTYQLYRRGVAVIASSPLGATLDYTDFREALSIELLTGPRDVTDHYRLWAGKRSEITYRAREIRVALENRHGMSLVIALRLSNDGLAYRYEFPAPAEQQYVVLSEHSGVRFLSGTRAWLQPKANAQTGWMNTNPSYEEDYLQDIPVGTRSPTESGWVLPALFRYGDSWIVLSETGMSGRYPGSNLAQDSPDGLYRFRFPQSDEVVTDGNLLAESVGRLVSAWRLLVIGNLETVMASTLGTDLAEPLAISAPEFVQPGIAAWSWGLLKDDSVVYPVQRAFIDYAAEMAWPYVLVDVDWDRRIGYERIAELAGYGGAKGVGLFVWYNSSGDWNQTVYSPKNRLFRRSDRLAEFARLESLGIRGVKIDFFPGDGASVIQYYVDLLQDAAAHRLMVNFHGTTLPRGLQRTFPNLVTSEAVKGFEFITFFQEVADREATHVAMLPFTRNLFDPMDFTPTVLGDIPDIERRTSNAFQLALPTLLLSGIQHIVTTPEQMHSMPDFVRDYLRELPGRWDESRFVDGYPGRYVVIARRSGSRWYVAGINAGKTRNLEFNIDFTGAPRGTLITDGDQPRALQMQTIRAGRQSMKLANGAGFVMVFDSE